MEPTASLPSNSASSPTGGGGPSERCGRGPGSRSRAFMVQYSLMPPSGRSSLPARAVAWALCVTVVAGPCVAARQPTVPMSGRVARSSGVTVQRHANEFLRAEADRACWRAVPSLVPATLPTTNKAASSAAAGHFPRDCRCQVVSGARRWPAGVVDDDRLCWAGVGGVEDDVVGFDALSGGSGPAVVEPEMVGPAMNVAASRGDDQILGGV